jgi:hypothetical protein
MATNLNSAIQQVAGIIEKLQREKPETLDVMFRMLVEPVRDALIASRQEIESLKKEVEDLKAKTAQVNTQVR